MAVDLLFCSRNIGMKFEKVKLNKIIILDTLDNLSFPSTAK